MKQLAIAVLAVLLSSGNALAQRPGLGGFRNPAAGGQPTFSPYLNLLRSGNSTTLNYYGLVRPQQDLRRRAIENSVAISNRTSLVQVDRNLRARTSTLGTTGHGSAFMQNLRGSDQSYRIGIIELNAQRDELPGITGSRMGGTGHFSLYGNRAGYFPR